MSSARRSDAHLLVTRKRHTGRSRKRSSQKKRWREGRWAPLERPDEIATAEVDKVEDKSIKRDIPIALRRGTIGQVTTHHALDGCVRPARARPPRMIRRSSLP
jgi:hypothetical protein